MTWYYCPGCKKKLRRSKRDMEVSGGKSFCEKTGKDWKLRRVTERRSD